MRYSITALLYAVATAAGLAVAWAIQAGIVEALGHTDLSGPVLAAPPPCCCPPGGCDCCGHCKGRD